MSRTPIQLWVGPECSVVRVRDRYVDQLALTGHDHRGDDLDRLSGLGARKMRFPLLWERTAPDGIERADWSWADVRLARLRRLGVQPIVGLVHHGSGPRSVSLLDRRFVDGLAEFAGAVARRYPWLEEFTPVNEPLTTARFSGLYGHWYPHARSDASFTRALLTECSATAAAMRAIRAVIPDARLVQTEDCGTVFSTAALRYQADFENERRFLGLDLIAGAVDRRHPLRAYLLAHGATDAELDALLDAPKAMDVIGLNYYVTSDRFLDERLERYPPHTHGGNGREAYADVEAVRVRRDGIAGHRRVLSTYWERYRRPVALTEVHLGCTVDEQIRWLAEAWAGGEEARLAGVDVRAVTAWSAFGACDWNSLLTESRGHYEAGLFDVRGSDVQPTALATVAAAFARHGTSAHPALAGKGWWHRPERLIYPPVGGEAATPSARRTRAAPAF